MTRDEARNIGSYEVSQAFYLTTFGHLTPRGHEHEPQVSPHLWSATLYGALEPESASAQKLLDRSFLTHAR
jgi:hypothetical protein